MLASEGLLSPEFASIEEYLGEHTPDYYTPPASQGGRYQPERDTADWVSFCIDAHLAQARRRLEQIEQAAARWASSNNSPTSAAGPTVLSSPSNKPSPAAQTAPATATKQTSRQPQRPTTSDAYSTSASSTNEDADETSATTQATRSVTTSPPPSKQRYEPERPLAIDRGSERRERIGREAGGGQRTATHWTLRLRRRFSRDVLRDRRAALPGRGRSPQVRSPTSGLNPVARSPRRSSLPSGHHSGVTRPVGLFNRLSGRCVRPSPTTTSGTVGSGRSRPAAASAEAG